MVDVEFVGEPVEEGGAVCIDLRFGERQVRCRFTEKAIRLYPPVNDDQDSLLDRFERHRDRFRALAGRKAATFEGGLPPDLTITENDLNR